MKNLFIVLVLFVFIAGCSLQNSEDYYTNEDGEKTEISNPYSSDTGHSAGYEWAERTGGACTGNSNSFNEGCEEYYRQAQ